MILLDDVLERNDVGNCVGALPNFLVIATNLAFVVDGYGTVIALEVHG